MIDKNILPDYSIEEEKLRLHAAFPLLAPAIATAIGAALGLTGTGLVLQKKIQNYFANNPGALDSITSKFGTKPGDQPEVEEELKELSKPVEEKIETWEGGYPDTEAGIALALSQKDKDKPVTTETEEPTPPEQKPPEDSDLLSELTKQTAEEVIRKQTKDVENGDKEFAEGLESYEETYSEEAFKELNEKYPKLSPANNTKIVEADKHFGAHALKHFTDDETQLIYLSPDEYLKLTGELELNDFSKAKIKYLEGKIKDDKEIGEIPLLLVGKEGNNYKVKMQEGRHRAHAFKNLGYDKIPVRIQGLGKDKKSGIENKVFTATPRSYHYEEPRLKDYIGFIPKKLISEREISAYDKEVKPEDFYDVVSKEKLFVKKEDWERNLYKTVNKAQHSFLMDSISEYTENISKGTMDKVNKLLYLNEKVTFTDKQLKELNGATADKRQLDYDNTNKKHYQDADEDLDLSIKENAELLNTVTEQEYQDLWQKLKNPKKIEKKAYGGLIDKPLIGGSRYI